ncbi:Uma2 family endonuclease [Micromonospora sp. BRA006-A]|nr:Uma2 family endonuclease [Micromonospora sp. BRA006-A]
MTVTSPARPGSGDVWTVDDLQDPEDGQDYEIFDGSLLVSPHADVRHGAIANRLRRLLDRQAPSGLLVGQDVGVSANRSSYFVPDVFVAREEALERGGPALTPADVLLVAEVVSPGNAGRDLVLKRHEYGVAGIANYLARRAAQGDRDGAGERRWSLPRVRSALHCRRVPRRPAVPARSAGRRIF